jgi:hypothetical protein
MKSRLTLIVLPILILISCIDDDTSSNQDFESVASEWFDKNTNPYIWGNKKARINWSQTSLVTDSNRKQYLVVPFKEYKTFENSDYMFSRKILFSYDNGEITSGKIIDFLSESKNYLSFNENQALMGILHQDLSEYQMEVFIYDLNFTQKNLDLKYSNRTKSQLTIKKEIGTANDNGRTADYMCTHWYYGSNSSGWEYLGSECYSLYEMDGGGSGGSGNDPIWEDYPGGGGEADTPDYVDYDQIARDDFNFYKIKDQNLKPCMKNILADIKNLNNGNIAQIIQTFSGSVPGYNWELKNGLLTNNQNAFTSQVYNKSTGTVTTTFDASKFTNASDLSIARTLLHESVHAFLVTYFSTDPLAASKSYAQLLQDYNKSQDANTAHHIEMTRNFVNDIGIALQEYGTNKGYNLNLQFYQDMAWGGLSSTPAFQALPQSDRNRINNTIQIELIGRDTQGNVQIQKGILAGC